MPECPCLWTVTYRRRYLGEDNHTRYDYDDSEYYYSEDRATQRKQEMDLSAWLREPRHDAFRLLDDICREGSGFTGEDVGILKGVHERYGHRSSADSTRMGQGGRYRRILAEIDTVAIRTIMLLL